MGLSKASRLLLMLAMTGAFFIVEIVFGYLSNSLALIADSFHMLSDVLALVIAYLSVRISKKQSDKNTYGWARAEVLGALVNSTFLLALCFSIFVDALKRLIDPEVVSEPERVLYVGVAGLVINILGLILFGGHAHAHGDDHGHGSGGHGHAEHADHSEANNNNTLQRYEPMNAANLNNNSHRHHIHLHDQFDDNSNVHSDDVPLTDPATRSLSLTSRENSLIHTTNISNNNSNNNNWSPTDTGSPALIHPQHNHHDHEHADSAAARSRGFSHESHQSNAAAAPPPPHSHDDLNMRAAFLHVLGDAIGSVNVIISALIIWKTEWIIKPYVDPVLSLILVLIILSTTLPVLRESAHVLLQTVPTHIQVDKLRRKLICRFPEIYSVHELHIWQLTGNKIIASAHIQCPSQCDYMQLAKRIKMFFHNEGIHSTTIQPEFTKAFVSSAAGAAGVKEVKSLSALDSPTTLRAAANTTMDELQQMTTAAPNNAVNDERLSYELSTGNPIAGIRSAICGDPSHNHSNNNNAGGSAPAQVRVDAETATTACAVRCPSGVAACSESMCCDPNFTPSAAASAGGGGGGHMHGGGGGAGDGTPVSRRRLMDFIRKRNTNAASNTPPVAHRELPRITPSPLLIAGVGQPQQQQQNWSANVAANNSTVSMA